MANLKTTQKKTKAQSMGMHTEVLTGKTQQKFFNPDEAENFFYWGTHDVDFNKRTELDVKDMDCKDANRKIDSLMSSYFGISSGLILSGTIFAIMFAYVVRFLAVSLQTVESGLEKIKPSMDDAARSLGYRPREALVKVHIPLLKSSSLTALMIVFVDVMKELPATLILRPFNFETLAVSAYNYASEERMYEAAAPSIAIVIVGLLPIIILSRMIKNSRPGETLW